MKQRMKEEGHRIRLRILLDFLPEEVNRKEIEKLYFSPGLNANDLFVQYLESKIDESMRDHSLKIAMDEERRQTRAEELKEFNEITKREKRLVRQTSIQTQTEPDQNNDSLSDRSNQDDEQMVSDLKPPFKMPDDQQIPPIDPLLSTGAT